MRTHERFIGRVCDHVRCETTLLRENGVAQQKLVESAAAIRFAVLRQNGATEESDLTERAAVMRIARIVSVSVGNVLFW